MDRFSIWRLPARVSVCPPRQPGAKCHSLLSLTSVLTQWQGHRGAGRARGTADGDVPGVRGGPAGPLQEGAPPLLAAS